MKARQPVLLLRARTWVYVAAMAGIALAMLIGLAIRQPLSLEVLRDRAPLYVRLADGGIRNSYTLKLADHRHVVDTLAVSVEGLPPGAVWQVLDATRQDATGLPLVNTRPDGVAEFRLFVTTPHYALPADEGTPVTIRLLPSNGGAPRAVATTSFLRPR